MFIDSITLNNFRAYKGKNSTCFKKNGKNVFVIAGNNGFGKTTYLTSLVWCLYGKLMVDVDDKFRRDINDAQGYKNFAKANLFKEHALSADSRNYSSEEKKSIAKKGYVGDLETLKDVVQYYVEIHITDVFIPSIPCSEVSIRRTYDYLLETESVEVLIDGHINELAREVGYDIFINDFILSKDIAKFFLFDAEKIVNLAEVKSIDEKRKLSTAYSEVLGIKKYEDIKRNLENLRIKFRKKGGSEVSQSKLERLSDDIIRIEADIKTQEEFRAQNDAEIDRLRAEKESLQEKLIREGNAISVEDLNGLKLLLEELKKKDLALKNKLKDMLDIAPFAISGSILQKTRLQVEAEQHSKIKTANTDSLISAMLAAKQAIINQSSKIALSTSQKQLLEQILDSSFESSLSEYAPSSDCHDVKVLLDYSDAESNAFFALYDNIKYSFSITFRQLVKDIKNNGLFLQKTQRKIAAAEYDDGDALIKDVRAKKAEVDLLLPQKEQDSRKASEAIAVLSKELSTKKKQLSECLKLVKVDAMDQDKDLIAERLINELSIFLTQLREARKFSLGAKIKAEIDILMHKTDFIDAVSIDLSEDVIDINLVDAEGRYIDKEKLSKGEQQLYATAILKALVEESGISFPVFIDSPLQKFDSIHSKNIITKFYPSVSKQVVIFPLLGKELSLSEYQDLLPNVNSSYVIQNSAGASSFLSVEPERIFEYVD